MTHAKSMATAAALAAVAGFIGYTGARLPADRWNDELVERRAAVQAPAAEAEAERADTAPPAVAAGDGAIQARAGVQTQPLGWHDPMLAILPSQPETPGSAQWGGLPDDDGVEEVYGLCGACHSLTLVTQQRVTPERWDHLLDWMVAEQGMPQLDTETRQRVLTYLSRHFAP